ncbi:MAG: hypothetical protein CMH83_13685 [Nocardioides sp.]|nr:hypothetical protein [Nocardioides sp.]
MRQDTGADGCATDLPLVVDLDGSLLRGDLLHETATRHLLAAPLTAGPDLLRWTVAGPARLKTELAVRTDLDVTALPYHREVLAWVRAEQARGREVVLASASHESLVAAVGEHVGVPNTLGTTAERNLRSEHKAAALVERYGEGGFEYVGNHRHDVAVWEHAAVAHVVGGSSRVASAAAAAAPVGRTFDGSPPALRSWWRSLRPHQWLKNGLVLLPLFTAQLLGDADAVRAAVLAFVVFCLVASSVYVLNDLADLDHDRHHPTKRRRPLPSGATSLLVGWVTWPVLALAGFGLSVALLPWMFTAVLAAYVALTLAYTFRLKSARIVDVVALAGLYTIRVLAGAAALDVYVSMWLLTFSLFFFLSLALLKRVSELTRARRTQRVTRGRGYVDADLELLSSYGVSSSIAAAVIFSLYVDDDRTQVLYQTPELLWGALPVLLTWVMRAWVIAHRGEMDEDPILFAARDAWSLVAGAAVVVVFVAAKVVVL